MNHLGFIGLLAWPVALASAGFAADDILDRVDDSLTFSRDHGEARARVSGLFDLEGYESPQPPPGILFTESHELFNPRLTTYLDAQLGPWIYIFAQARADRGFDPGDERLQWRLDEYALRLALGHSGKCNLQVGKFATVVGNWVARHDSWSNPLVTAPLPYENLTGLWDTAAPRSAEQVLAWAHVLPGSYAETSDADKYRQIPIIWGPSYTLGAAVSGVLGRVDYALEIKNGSLSSRPEAWTDTAALSQHPTVSGRFGYRPNEMWNLGLSASSGPYLLPSAIPTLPSGRGLGNYRETVLGQDIGFAWHHFQFWSEVYATRFSLADVGHADTWAYYLEAKYKFTPQFFGALRWNQQFFGTVNDREGAAVHWGRALCRLDLGPGYRFTPHTQFKLQVSLQHEAGDGQHFTASLAAQFTARF